MAEFVYYALTYVDYEFGAGGLFAVCLWCLTVAFLIAITVAVFVKGNALKKRLWFISFSVSISGLELGLSLILGYGIGFSVVILSVGALLSIPVFMVRVRGKADKNQLELARFIDEKLRSAGAENQTFERDKPKDFLPPIPTQEIEEEKPFTAVNVAERTVPNKTPCEIDFSHVKNVISRLEYFPLNTNDKKQVKDLQGLVYGAENGDYNPQLKSRINDGLGNLLKIMAKYGV